MGETPCMLASQGDLSIPSMLPPPAPVAGAGRSPGRVGGVDALRGLIMALMAIDHVRDFYSPTLYAPEDLAHTNAALFFTRWITHFCAPAFVFLAGTGAYLFHASGRSKAETARFLLTRGFFLVALELLVINPIINPSAVMGLAAGHIFFLLLVIWVIGWSMVLLAGLIWLPLWAVAAVGFVLVLGHNLLDPIVPPGESDAWSPGWKLWAFLHLGKSFMPLVGGLQVFVLYPLIPWPGVMALGYALGAVLTLEARSRRRWLLILGGLAITGFVVLRGLNGYGDPQPWSRHDRGRFFTFMSFLNCEKYPPSLLYLLMTLGPSLWMLALLDWARGPLAEALKVFGRVPLFFYILHFALIQASSLALSRLAGWPLSGSAVMSNQYPQGYNPRLWAVYPLTLTVLAILYLPCRWYGRQKRLHPEIKWMRYL